MRAAATWRTGSKGHSIPIATEGSSPAGRPRGCPGRRDEPASRVVVRVRSVKSCSAYACQRCSGGRTRPTAVRARSGSAVELSAGVQTCNTSIRCRASRLSAGDSSGKPEVAGQVVQRPGRQGARHAARAAWRGHLYELVRVHGVRQLRRPGGARHRAGEVPQELDPVPLRRRSAAVLRGRVHRRRARRCGPAPAGLGQRPRLAARAGRASARGKSASAAPSPGATEARRVAVQPGPRR